MFRREKEDTTEEGSIVKTAHIDQEALAHWVDTLIRDQMVYGVQSKEDRFAFDPLESAADLRLDYDVTILPPKKYFQPQREVLLTFDPENGFQSVLHEEPFVLFGVHPYDMVAISQMDAVFTQRHTDAHYKARRDNATIVVSDVQSASENVFAACMGNATMENRNGYDVLLTQVDDGSYVVEAVTEKGEALAASLADAPDADEAVLAARNALRESNRAALQKHELKMDPAEIPDLLEKSMNHPVWAEKAEQCYSCGSCNMVCPTCYCFNVQEEPGWDLKSSERTRTWDGCMLTAFAAVAGGHNFREDKAARYRHRYLRKGKYVPEMLEGEISCVGCGRCITACTVNIANPVEIFNRLLEEE